MKYFCLLIISDIIAIVSRHYKCFVRDVNLGVNMAIEICRIHALHFSVLDMLDRSILQHERSQINKRIKKLMSLIEEGVDPERAKEIVRELFSLRETKRQIKRKIRPETERITAELRQLWMHRNESVSRGSTSAVSDMMLLTMPVPPTAEAAYCSLWQRGMASGAVA